MATVTAALIAEAVAPAPTGLAATLIGPAVASAVVSAASLPAITLNLLYMINSTKIAVGVSAVAVAGVVGTYVGMEHVNGKLRAEVAAVQKSVPHATPFSPQTTSVAFTPAEAEELARLRAEHGELMRCAGKLVCCAGIRRSGTVFEPSRRSATGPGRRRRLEEKVQKAVETLSGAKMNFTIPWAHAFQSFARDHDGQMAKTFNQVTNYLPQTEQAVAVSFPIKSFEIVFQGSLAGIMEPVRTIILREKQPFNVDASGAASRTYLFADGHAEIHVAPDGNFQPWERERMVASEP